MAEFEKKPYEYSAEITFNPSMTILNDDSLLSRLKYWNMDSQDHFEDLVFSAEAGGSYEWTDLKILTSLKYSLIYNTDTDWDDDVSLFELYGQYSAGTHLTFWLGKKTVKWGRGYIWNPVSFAGRQKDINDVDASLEGYTMGMGEMVRSFNSRLKTLAATVTVLPVFDDINSGFSEPDTVSFISQIYLLIADMDVGIYGLADTRDNVKLGVDMAYNILTNWEIHGEYARENNREKQTITPDGSVTSLSGDADNLLLGTRFLTSWNGTFILEYLHNDAGFSSDEMIEVFQSMDSALNSGQSDQVSKMKAFQKDVLTRQFLMRDYLYLKYIQPEPFDILYFTPAVFAVWNLQDDSCRVGLEMKTTRFENWELMYRQNLFSGSGNTEFGEKAAQLKAEIFVRYYF